MFQSLIREQSLQVRALDKELGRCFSALKISVSICEFGELAVICLWVKSDYKPAERGHSSCG
jgi:hypothetical protein